MRKTITLALLGVFIAGATALAQDRDTVQNRLAAALADHAAAHAHHAEDRAAWLAAMAVYPPDPETATSDPPPDPERPAPVAADDGHVADFEERLGFALGYVNDGGCAVPSKTLSGSYARESADRDIYAAVRTAPSGGDCETNATSFSLAIERRYALGAGWDGVAKFGADRRSVSAPYALVDAGGAVVTRPDGNPSDPVTLPAGSRDTVGGYLGVSREIAGGFRVTGAFNVVPVTWATAEDSFAGHFAVAWDHGNTFDLQTWADIGRDWFGAARASWRPATSARIGVEISAEHAWGLNSIDGGEPAAQTFAGLPVAIQGAARDHSTAVAIGITF